MMYEVGQEVVRRATHRHGGNERTGTVVKVARKYVTVEFPYSTGHGAALKEFDKETGAERSNGYMPSSRIKTAAEWAAQDRRQNAVKALRDARVEIYRASLSDEQVHAIAAILGLEY